MTVRAFAAGRRRIGICIGLVPLSSVIGTVAKAFVFLYSRRQSRILGLMKVKLAEVDLMRLADFLSMGCMLSFLGSEGILLDGNTTGNRAGVKKEQVFEGWWRRWV